MRGWLEYEWRWKAGELAPRGFTQPLWRGEPLSGRAILLHAEQGLGDTIQFVRYAELIQRLGAQVIVECQPLTKLLATSPGVDRLVARGDKLPSFDFQAPLLSLPAILKTTSESIPANIPYLAARPAMVEQWREKLNYVEGIRVGIHSHGQGGQGTLRRRNIPLDCFAPLAAVPDVRLISLQKGAAPEDRNTLKRLSVVDLDDNFDVGRGAFVDTAAIMMNLDLAISSDTSIAHLAGALGVPVWVALPLVPDWRWLLDRSDSPWYPTMRLFRQKSAGDWAGVFAEIEASLRELVVAKHKQSG